MMTSSAPRKKTRRRGSRSRSKPEAGSTAPQKSAGAVSTVNTDRDRSPSAAHPATELTGVGGIVCTETTLPITARAATTTAEKPPSRVQGSDLKISTSAVPAAAPTALPRPCENAPPPATETLSETESTNSPTRKNSTTTPAESMSSSTAATTFKTTTAAPPVHEKRMAAEARRTGRQPAATPSMSSAVPAAEWNSTTDVRDAQPTPSAPAVITVPPALAVTSVQPEQHVDGDAVESAMRKLKGTRPELLRTSTYYEGAKSVYIFLAGLPVLGGIAPTVEAVTESIINMTPLKPSPEEAEQKSVAVLDKRICEALSYADEVVDVKKDEIIEGMVSVKKAINTLGPVQAVAGVACNVGDGVGKAYGSANDTVGKVWHQVFDAASGTYTGVTTMASKTVNSVTHTAGNAASNVTTTTGNIVNSARCTAGNTIDGVKSIVGSTADSIGSSVNWAASTTMSLISAAVSIPVGLVQSILGTNKSEPSEK